MTCAAAVTAVVPQADLFEIMYRCAKAYHERAYKKYLDAQVNSCCGLSVGTLHYLGRRPENSNGQQALSHRVTHAPNV